MEKLIREYELDGKYDVRVHCGVEECLANLEILRGMKAVFLGGLHSHDRNTPVGRFIRKCRIDELPQLINILKGDLSICGPRPERPEIAAQYCREMPEFALRLQAKAGLTGYAQVYGKYNTTPYDKLQMDLMYIARPSTISASILRLPMGTATGCGARKTSSGRLAISWSIFPR